MDDDPGYNYIEKFRGPVQWYMMESKDLLSTICFKLKKKRKKTNKYHSTVNQKHLDYRSRKCNR